MMATKAEIEASARILCGDGIVQRARALDLARDMLEAAEDIRLNELHDIFGGIPCKECGALHFKRE